MVKQAAVVGIVSRCGLRIEVRHRNKPNKSNTVQYNIDVLILIPALVLMLFLAILVCIGTYVLGYKCPIPTDTYFMTSF